MLQRILLLLVLAMGSAGGLFGQIEDPVKWDFEHEKVAEGEFLLKFIASIEPGWYLYSQDIPEGGPVATSFEFKKGKTWVSLGDKVEEVGKVISAFEPMFDMEVKKYKEKVVFQQRIKTTKAVDRIKGTFEYMTCDDEKCLPPKTENFRFIVGKGDGKKSGDLVDKSSTPKLGIGDAAIAGGGIAATQSKKNKIEDPVAWSYDWVELRDSTFEIRFKAKIEEGWHVYSQINNAEEGPQPTLFTFDDSDGYEWIDNNVIEEGKLKSGIDPVFKVLVNKFAHEITFKRKLKLNDFSAKVKGNFEYMTCDDGKCLFPAPVYFEFNQEGYVPQVLEGGGPILDIPTFVAALSDCGEGEPAESTDGKSIWAIFLLGFLGGMAALLTPCVFPMIPLTVSFFTKQSGTRAKGLRNAIIYALSIIVIYVTMGFFVTVAFGADALNALSTDPWFNIGFFILFVVFAISFFGYFEITLPSWLVNKSDAASEKGGLIGIFFMAFTLALVSFSCTGPIIGTLLVDAAINGEHLGPVTGMFGFALALSLPFALFAMFPSWLNSLPRSGGWLNTVKVVLGFIELIFAMKFLSNADLTMQWGLLKRETFLVIWMILLSGLGAYLFGLLKFPHDSPIKKLGVPRVVMGLASFGFALYLIPGLFCKALPIVAGFPPPTFYSYGCGAEELHDEKQFHGIADLETGLDEAKVDNKPVLLDFTGWACVNCRRMEENVWPEVSSIIDEYTLVSLYVDEKISLPDEKKVWVEVNGKRWQLLTVGNKWSYLQQQCFMTNSQPYYALLTPEGELLANPVGYTPDVPTYSNWLQEGLKKFQTKRKNPRSI